MVGLLLVVDADDDTPLESELQSILHQAHHHLGQSALVSLHKLWHVILYLQTTVKLLHIRLEFHHLDYVCESFLYVKIGYFLLELA